MSIRLIQRGQIVWSRDDGPGTHVYMPPPVMNAKQPELSDRTMAHGIYHRHILNAPAEQGWMERSQLLDWANLDGVAFIVAAWNQKLLDCAIDMQTGVEVYRVLNPSKLLPFALEWKRTHKDTKVKRRDPEKMNRGL
jgi:hypothetical protein